MLKGFRDFILRGNVVDLAVGVVIGVAFTGVVTAFTNSFVNPLIKVFTGSSNPVKAGSFEIRHQYFTWAVFVNAVINLLLVALVLYFLIVYPMNRLQALRKRGKAPEPAAPSDEVRLLTEIRDALTGNGNGAVPAQRVEQEYPQKIT